jgi:predicted RNase H-like nuclease (RuvC/YqgF family)
MNITKRLTNDKNFVRPKKTYQDTLTGEKIREMLNGYKMVDDIHKTTPGTHLRYFAKEKGSNERKFRMGGFLSKFGDNNKYIVLNNGTYSWSVQLNNYNEFWAKMGKDELNNVMTNENDKIKSKYSKMKEQNSYLTKLLEEQTKKYEKLAKKLSEIEEVAKKSKKS